MNATPTILQLPRRPTLPFVLTWREASGYARLNLTSHGCEALTERVVAVADEGVAETLNVWILPESRVMGRETVR